MAKELRLRRGTTAQHSTFTGANGEVTLDTTKKTLVVHDGATAGGVPLMRESGTTGAVNFATTSGNVGIGTSTPNFRADILASNFRGLRVQSSGDDAIITMGSQIASSQYWSIAATSNTSGQGANNFIIETTDANAGGTVTPRLTISSAGNLGLGVTPSAWGGSSKILQISNAAFRGAGNSAYVGANYYFDGSNNRYIASAAASLYEQDAGRHIFYTAPSGTAGNAISFTQAMTLDASGNLGVGTTSPSGRVSSAVPDGTTNALYLERTGGSPAQFSVTFANQFSNLISSGVMTFAVNGSERARIDSSGNLLVGTTSQVGFNGGAGANINANGAFRNGVSGSGDSSAWQRSSTGNYLAFFYGALNTNPTGVGSINTNGTSTTYSTSSDYRLKHDIQPMTGALAKVAALKPVTYKWNVDGSDGEGFIAHELAEVCPDAVTGEKDATRMEQYEISPAVPATYDEEGNELTPAVEAVMGEREVPVYQGIDTSFLVATLTAAIQEQQAIIEQLKSDVAALKAASNPPADTATATEV